MHVWVITSPSRVTRFNFFKGDCQCLSTNLFVKSATTAFLWSWELQNMTRRNFPVHNAKVKRWKGNFHRSTPIPQKRARENHIAFCAVRTGCGNSGTTQKMSDFCAGYGGKVASSENSMVWKGVGPGVIEEGFERIRCFAVVQSTNATLSEFCIHLWFQISIKMRTWRQTSSDTILQSVRTAAVKY